MNNELVRLTESIPLEKPKAQVVMEQFNQFFDQVSGYESRAKSIEITDISQTDKMKEARDIRLKLKDIRVNADKVKRRLKENIIIEDRFICGCYNIIEGSIKPIENDLLEKEKYVERIEQARLEKIRQERFDKLAEVEVDGTFFDLVNMPEEAFNILFETSKTNYNNKIEAEKKAEQERLAREKAEIEEREKIKAENERLKKEAEARELEIKKEKERIEKENAERLAKEEAEKKAKLEAEEKQRQASLMPDKNKLLVFASSIDTMQMPELSTTESNQLLSEVKIKLTAISNFIRENCQKL
jgi:hypothetical protein